MSLETESGEDPTLDPQIGLVNLSISDSSSSLQLAELEADFSAELDWSELSGEAEERKSFIHNQGGLDNLPGLVSQSLTLLTPIPDDIESDGLLICPDTLELDTITQECASGEILQESSDDLSKLTINEKSYWALTNTSNAGTSSLLATGQECENDGECSLNYCVDGYCCNSPCDQDYYRCDTSDEGTCINTMICGDGAIIGTEECDDGNTEDYDGCSNQCEIETAWGCSGEPSDCELLDSDNDGYKDWEEILIGTDPNNPLSRPTEGEDTPNDSASEDNDDNSANSDEEETAENDEDAAEDDGDTSEDDDSENTYDDPEDLDNDGVHDDIEQELGTDKNKKDTDGDGLSDGEELRDYDTDPLSSDTDNDGFSDKEEIENDTDPTDPEDFPQKDVDGKRIGDWLRKNPLYLVIPVFFILAIIAYLIYKILMKKD
jgi:cysteine-rich repeat protein